MDDRSVLDPEVLHMVLQVPITLYFMTHAYFCLYHAISNLLIRRMRHAVAAYGPAVQVRRVWLVLMRKSCRIIAACMHRGSKLVSANQAAMHRQASRSFLTAGSS
jgi:hypothetical protein